MAYGKSKDLTKRTQSEKALKDKAFKTATIKNMMAIKEDQLQWFTNFMIKSLVEVVLTLNQTISLQMDFIGRLLQNSKDERFIHCLETILGVLV